MFVFVCPPQGRHLMPQRCLFVNMIFYFVRKECHSFIRPSTRLFERVKMLESALWIGFCIKKCVKCSPKFQVSNKLCCCVLFFVLVSVLFAIWPPFGPSGIEHEIAFCTMMMWSGENYKLRWCWMEALITTIASIYLLNRSTMSAATEDNLDNFINSLPSINAISATNLSFTTLPAMLTSWQTTVVVSGTSVTANY